MGTTNRDASQIIKQKQQAALYGYYSKNIKNVAIDGIVEQQGGLDNSVRINRNLGACVCDNYASSNGSSTRQPDYPPNNAYTQSQ